MNYLFLVICWYLRETWQEVRFVARLVSAACVRHGKKSGVLFVICWYLCEIWQGVQFVACDLWYLRETWKEVRFVACDLLVSS